MDSDAHMIECAAKPYRSTLIALAEQSPQLSLLQRDLNLRTQPLIITFMLVNIPYVILPFEVVQADVVVPVADRDIVIIELSDLRVAIIIHFDSPH